MPYLPNRPDMEFRSTRAAPCRWHLYLLALAPLDWTKLDIAASTWADLVWSKQLCSADQISDLLCHHRQCVMIPRHGFSEVVDYRNSEAGRDLCSPSRRVRARELWECGRSASSPKLACDSSARQDGSALTHAGAGRGIDEPMNSPELPFKRIKLVSLVGSGWCCKTRLHTFIC